MSNLNIFSSINMIFPLIGSLIATFVCERFCDFLVLQFRTAKCTKQQNYDLSFDMVWVNAPDHPSDI